MKNKIIKPVDLLIIAAIIIICGIFILNINHKKQGYFAIISVNGEKAAAIPLSEDRLHFNVEGADNIYFTVKNGIISVDETDCPDKICLKTGGISSKGQSIICVPNHVTVTVSEKNPSQTDNTVIIG